MWLNLAGLELLGHSLTLKSILREGHGEGEEEEEGRSEALKKQSARRLGHYSTCVSVCLSDSRHGDSSQPAAPVLLPGRSPRRASVSKRFLIKVTRETELK